LIALALAFRLDSVDRAMRWHARYYRQNGIHESPTFMINRLVEPKMSSRQTIKEWSELLRPHLDV
jgi:aryl carrier-like protein